MIALLTSLSAVIGSLAWGRKISSDYTVGLFITTINMVAPALPAMGKIVSPKTGVETLKVLTYFLDKNSSNISKAKSTNKFL